MAKYAIPRKPKQIPGMSRGLTSSLGSEPKSPKMRISAFNSGHTEVVGHHCINQRTVRKIGIRKCSQISDPMLPLQGPDKNHPGNIWAEKVNRATNAQWVQVERQEEEELNSTQSEHWSLFLRLSYLDAAVIAAHVEKDPPLVPIHQ